MATFFRISRCILAANSATVSEPPDPIARRGDVVSGKRTKAEGRSMVFAQL